MATRAVVPVFGALSGVKVLNASLTIAGPFAAQMMADFGADVIWLESPLMMDIARTGSQMLGQQDRRNQRTISLNIPSPEGREIFLRLIKAADIFIEASKGGQYAKWGLTDEVLWEHNPALVIVHISGFGQDGIKRHVARPSFDPIAQAFGCFMNLNGFPDRPPIAAVPFVADYFTGLFALGGALAALYKARETGRGDSIDVAQYETMIRLQPYLLDYMNLGVKPRREGSQSAVLAGWGSFPCRDGQNIFIAIGGGGVLKNALQFLGLEFGSAEFPSNKPNVFRDTPGGVLLTKKLEEYCTAKTAAEAEDELIDAGVPCSIIMDYEMAVTHPHYQAREVFIEWETMAGQKIKGINTFPKFKNNPGKVWRAMPGIGMDNEEILADLGLTDSEIQSLYEKKVIVKR